MYKDCLFYLIYVLLLETRGGRDGSVLRWVFTYNKIQQFKNGQQLTLQYYMMIIRLSILFLTARAIIIDPINSTCVQGSAYSLENHSEFGIHLHYFNLPPFSETIIQLDLRHLESIPKTSENESFFIFKAEIIQQNKITYQPILNIQAKSNRFSFHVNQPTKLGLYFELKDGKSAYKYLLYESVSIRVIKQNIRVPEQEASFLFVISSFNNINLPLNRPNVASYSGYCINKIQTNITNTASTTVESVNSYWTTFTSLAVPFIPYVSNCKNQGNNMYLSQLMENADDCNLKSIEDTVPIYEFRFGSYPEADTCKIQRQCIYEEYPGISTQFPYWQNLPLDSVLFSITQNKISYRNYQIDGVIDDNELVQCKINESKGTNSSGQFPLNVKLTLQYYQVTKQVKKMIACTVSFSLYMESSSNFTYQFQLETKPLNHTYIMLAFGFQWYIYMIIFLIIGLISNFENLVLWLFHSCVSRKQKRQFKIRLYLKIIMQIGKGTFVALIFCIILLFSITLIMNGKIFDKQLYRSDLPNDIPRVFWDYLNNQYINDYQSTSAVKYRAGRMGFSFLIVGSVILFYTSKYFIGCEKGEKQYKQYQIMGRILKPRQWNKGKFIFGTYVYICIQFFFIYFAYSALYSQNIWTFIVLMKIVQIIMEEITLSIYGDLLPCLPLKVITDITAYMNTLSANNFYDFLFSFLIDVAITMIEKAYVSQLQNIVVQKIHKKMEQFVKFYAHLINDTDGQINQTLSQQVVEEQDQNQFVLLNGQAEQVKFFDNEEVETHTNDNDIELKLEQVKDLQKLISHKLLGYRRYENKQFSQAHNNETDEIQNADKNQQEKMEEASVIFQMLLDNILLLFTFFLQPFVILVYWITYDESTILNNYGISSNVVILYLLSAIVIAFFTIINMILIFHLLQSYLEIDFDEQIVNMLDRFVSRKMFWKARDEDINRLISIEFRGAEHYCLSWQFFFILTIFISAMILVMLGLSIMINVSYNPFKDIAVTLILLFWYCFTITSIWLIQRLAYKFNIDGWSDFDADSKNKNAIADFSVRQEIQRKNSYNQQGTNQPLTIINENSQHQLLNSTLNFIKSKKQLSKIESMSLKALVGNPEFNEQDQMEENSEMSQQTLNNKVHTICKKLQPKFGDRKFNIEYFRKNKEFIKQNIQKILPLMSELPEINQYRIPGISFNEVNSKKQNKSYDPGVSQIMNKWRYKSDSLQQQRKSKGKQLQEGLTSCSFCFSSWGIYYGFNGMCLKCSKDYQKAKKQC